MPRTVDIPDVGVVEFPDSMADATVSLIAKRLHLDAMNKKPISERGMTGETGPEASLRTATTALENYPSALLNAVIGGPMAGYRVLKAGADKGVVGAVNQVGSEAAGMGRGIAQTVRGVVSGDPQQSGEAAANLGAIATLGAASEYGPRAASAVGSKLPGAIQIMRHPLRSGANAAIDAVLERLSGGAGAAPQAPQSGMDALQAVTQARGRPMSAADAVKAAQAVQQGATPQEALARLTAQAPSPEHMAVGSEVTAPPTPPPSAPVPSGETAYQRVLENQGRSAGPTLPLPKSLRAQIQAAMDEAGVQLNGRQWADMFDAVKAGTPAKTALQTILKETPSQAQAAQTMAERFGLQSDAEMQARINARNMTGRWQK